MTTQTDALVEDQRQGTIPEDTFRARLMLARMHAGDLTIREAAEKTGLNHASWANWERGMKPRDLLDVVDQISEGLGVDREWLLRGGRLADEVRRRRDRHGRRDERASGRINERSSPRAARTRPELLHSRPPVSRTTHDAGHDPGKSTHRGRHSARPAWTCEGVTA